MRGKIIIALNTAWNLYNFRAGLIRALVAEGYEVVAVAPDDEYAPRLRELGCRFVALPMDNKGTHPGRDLLLLWRFFRLMRRERPDVYLGYTVKPNIYGSLAAHALGIPVVNNIAGLGAVFVRENWLTHLVRRLYRVALARSYRVFFQNKDDRQAFVHGGIVRLEQTQVIPGSGVDLVRFPFTPIRSNEGGLDQGSIRFLLVARMLWDKGVGEYVAAARLVRQRYPHAEFCLLGFLDVQNPTAISAAQMEEWVAEGVVRYLGVTDDVKPFLVDADCVVLPSYREGVPRTLLEAAAIGRPIIATDAVGCREAVDDGENGYLVRPKDPADLAEKMIRFIESPYGARQKMARASRKKVELEFDEKIVIGQYLQAVDEIVSSCSTSR